MKAKSNRSAALLYTLSDDHCLFVRVACVFVILAWTGGVASADADIFPLSVSADGRQIVDSKGRPFFINGDTAWSLIGQVSKEDAEFYLSDCVEAGFNTIVVTLVERFYADNAPANYYGVQPFLVEGKFATPNEEYFDHADWVIRRAEYYGILVLLAPLYLGCCNDGWLAEFRDYNSEEEIREFGAWVGNRFKDRSNIIYVWGGDADPGPLRERLKKMIDAARSADPRSLHTYHAVAEHSTADVWDSSFPIFDINLTYTYQGVQAKLSADLHRMPFLPFFLFESQYEADFLKATPLQVRKQAYVAVLSGAGGNQYGNNPIWHMNGKVDDQNSSWKDHLNAEGRRDMIHMRNLFESRQWDSLIPDEAHTFVETGYGRGQDFVASAITKDRATGIVYFPRFRSITIDVDEVRGSNKTAWWFNPRNGQSLRWTLPPASGLSLPTLSRYVTVVPPDNDDWILVVDDSDALLGAPGAVQQGEPDRMHSK